MSKGKVLNLNRARKAKVKADKRRVADENTIRFGKSKSERQKEEREQELERRRWEGTRLNDAHEKATGSTSPPSQDDAPLPFPVSQTRAKDDAE